MRRTPYAFTRFDLLAIVAAFGLIAAITAPVLAGRADIDRAVCANNLRLVGRAMQAFAMDHEQKTPWWTHLADGGTRYTPKAAFVWFEVAALSNGAPTPRIFACPADLAGDPALRPVHDFPEFWTMRQNAVSYALNLHAGDSAGSEWVLSDRNLRFDSDQSACPLIGANTGMVINSSTNHSELAWTNSVHGERGNVLFLDGTVEFTSTPRVRELMLKDAADGVSAHVLKAR